jgi:Flp pilus assembly protein TadD
VRYKPDLTPAYVRLGEALAQQGRTNEALEPLNHALRLNPSDQEAHQILRRLQNSGSPPAQPN